MYVKGLKVNMIGEVHGCLPHTVRDKENPDALKAIYSANVGVANGFLSICWCDSNNYNCINIPGKKLLFSIVIF